MRACPRALVVLTLLSLLPLGFAEEAPAGYAWQRIDRSAASPNPYPNDSTGLRTEIVVEGAVMLKLHFQTIDIERGFDFVKLLDERGELVDSLTGQSSNTWSPVIQGSRAYLDLYSDYSTNGRGFVVDIIEACLPVAPPPTTRPADPPVIPGPGFPGGEGRWVESPIELASPSPYPKSVHRQAYPITAEGAEAVRLYFEFLDVEENFDFVDLECSHGNQIARYTGSRSGFWTDPVPGPGATLLLTSDFSIQGRGFRVTRIAARLPDARPPQPTRISRVELLRETPRGTEPLVGGVHQLAQGEQLILVVRALDARGREVAAAGIDCDVRGDIGRLEQLASGRFLFTAGNNPGRFGEIRPRVAGYAGEVPPLPVAVTFDIAPPQVPVEPPVEPPVRGEHGLALLEAEVLDGSLRPLAGEGGAYRLLIGTEGQDRAIVRIRGFTSNRRPIERPFQVQHRVIARRGTLEVVERSDGAFVVVAGEQPARDARVQFFTITRRGGREVAVELRFDVEVPPRRVARLIAGLPEGGVDLRAKSIEMIVGSEPVDIVISSFDQFGQPYLPRGFQLRPELLGDRVVQVRDLGDCRFRLTPMSRAGEAQILFRGSDGQVQTAPVRCEVRAPRYSHTVLLVNQGGQWVEMGEGAPLELNPQGLGLDSCEIELRSFDELGNVLPDGAFRPNLILASPGGGARPLALDRLAPNRFRLRVTGAEAADGLQLLLREPGGRAVLMSRPVRVVKPVPQLAEIRLLSREPSPRNMSGQTLRLPLVAVRGQSRTVDFEVAAFDQFGRQLHGYELAPRFRFEGGVNLCQLRRMSEVPSVWRASAFGDEELGPVRCTVDVQGVNVSTSFLVETFDPSFLNVGTQTAERWVQWGLRRDYDFAVPRQAEDTRKVRISASGRFGIDTLYLQLEDGSWHKIPGTTATIERGGSVRFDLPAHKLAVKAIRVHGHSQPGCQISCAVQRQDLLEERPGRGDRPGRGPGRRRDR